MWGKGEFHSRGSFAVTLLDTADVWCSKLPLASASFAATQPSLPACLPSTYASNRSVAATTTLRLSSLLPCVPLTVPFCRQKCCKFELNCESPTTALIMFPRRCHGRAGEHHDYPPHLQQGATVRRRRRPRSIAPSGGTQKGGKRIGFE